MTQVTVYFKKPPSWSESIQAYAWQTSDGQVQQLRGDWPGELIQEDHSDWYHESFDVATLNSSAELKVIFNDGSNQTVDLSRPLSVADSYFIATGSTDGKVTGQWHPGIPSELEPKVLIALSVSPAPVFMQQGETETLTLTGHYDDGSTRQISEGYSVTIADPAIVSNNSNQITAINPGQTEVTLSFNGVSSTLDVFVEQISTASVTLYYDNQQQWQQVCAYAWKSNPITEVLGEWPGTSAEQLEGDYYFANINEADFGTDGTVNLIFNNCDNGQQTEDLSRTLAEGEGFYANGNWHNGSPIQNTTIEVLSGQPSGVSEHRAGTNITITANSAPQGMKFSRWIGSGSSLLADAEIANQSITLPVSDTPLRFEATYEDFYADGKRFFIVYCSGCHGTFGQGDVKLVDVASRFSLESLINKIETTMPAGAASQCTGECASETARLIFDNAFDQEDFSCSAPLEPLERRIRLLSRSEYQNTVADLFALPNFEIDAKEWPSETRSGGIESFTGGYTNAATRLVTGTHLEGYVDIAKRVADQVDIRSLTQCADDNACVVDNLLLNGFRRPATSAEANHYLTILEQEGERRFVIRLLSSPYFAYRFEQGEFDGTHFQLTPFETASMLSYMFWESLPDATLLNAAAQNQLSTPEQLAAQAARLLSDPRANRSIHSFTEGWLGIHRLNSVSKEDGLDFELRDNMRQETLSFMANLVINDGHYQDIYQADFSYLNQSLASYYAIDQTLEETFEQVIYPQNHPRHGVGILGHASIHASFSKSNNSFPVRRGLFVRRNLLCQQLPAPVGINNDIGSAEPGETAKQHLERATADQPCASCHTYMNGQGYAFEHFDHLGRYRATEVVDGISHPIDATGTLYNSNVADSSYVSDFGINDTTQLDGLPSLAEALANSQNGAACFARQYYHYASGLYDLDKASYCRIKQASDAFATQNPTLKDYMIGLTRSPLFLVRQ